MKIYRNILFLLLLSILSKSEMRAQYIEMGIGLGQSVYWGDLNAPDFSTNISNRKFAGQIFLRYNHSQNLSFKSNIMFAKIAGDDRNSPAEWQQLRNLRFESNILEASLLAEYYIFGIDHNAGKIFSPYITGGLAMFKFNPTTDYNGSTVNLQPLGTEGQGISGFGSKYSTVALAVPFGGGAKITLTEKLSLNIDIVARRTFTDYLDDLSGFYVDYNELLAGNGQLAAALGNRQGEALGLSEPVIVPTGTQRGGQTVRDYYFTFMVSVNYYLGSASWFSKRGSVSTSNCPTF